MNAVEDDELAAAEEAGAEREIEFAKLEADEQEQKAWMKQGLDNIVAILDSMSTRYQLEIYGDGIGGHRLGLILRGTEDGMRNLNTLRAVCERLGVRNRKYEKVELYEGTTYWKVEGPKFSIHSDYNQCKIVGYKDVEEIIPGKPEQVIPEEPERVEVRKKPIYDCSE